MPKLSQVGRVDSSQVDWSSQTGQTWTSRST